MPELPEVETVVRTLRPLVVGKTVSEVQILWSRTVAPQDPMEIADQLRRRTITSVTRRAKLIVFLLDDDSRLTVHLRMTGELLYAPPSGLQNDRTPYLRALISFTDGSQLRFDDIRKFGRIRKYDSAAWEVLDEELGVEPLEPDFTPEALHGILQSRRRQLKPLLLDQTAIAGLGNIYVDESLYLARLHPLQRSNRVGREKSADLHAAITEVLRSAIDNQGTTLRNYRTGLGESGNNQTRLQIYGSPAGSPCPRCGQGLKRITVGQRGTVFCPNCQRRH